MLDKEFNFYIENQKMLLEEYKGLFLVIVGCEVVGHYATFADAYNDSSKKYTPGTFLIQHCTEGNEAYTQSFTSRVIFA